MTVRCPECNYKAPDHGAHCRAGIDESRPMTSAERYRSFPVDAYPPHVRIGDCDTRPQGERYFPLDNAIAHEAFDDFKAAVKEPETAKPEPFPEPVTALPTAALARKELPMASGLLDYFPAALVAIAGLSRVGNEQHNPGKPMHWDRAKSGDEADALMRHLVERGTIDTDGLRHSVKVAWRALALLQKELEAEGLAPISRGSR